jgi:DNA-binding LacI/PurR family transcriptional regulator
MAIKQKDSFQHMSKRPPKKDKKAVYALLLERIESGELAPGDKLPTERELAAEYATTLWSVHSAIDELDARNVVERRRSLGTFVRRIPQQGELAAMRSDSFKRVAICISRSFYYRDFEEDLLGILETALGEKGCEVEYLEFPAEKAAFQSLLETCGERGFKALVLFPELAEWDAMFGAVHLLESLPLKTIVFNRGQYYAESLPVNMVSLDIRHSGQAAAQLVLQRGFADIAYCAGATNRLWSQERREGFTRILNNLQVPFAVFHEREMELAEALIPYIRDRNSRPALIFPNDQMAAEICRELKSADLEMNRDYVPISFDNHPDYGDVPLFTFGWPLEEVGNLMAKCVVEKINAKAHDNILLKYSVKAVACDRTGNGKSRSA